MIEVWHKPYLHRISTDCEHDGDRGSSSFGYFCGDPAECSNQRDSTLHQLLSKWSQFRILFCRPQIGRYVAAFDNTTIRTIKIDK